MAKYYGKISQKFGEWGLFEKMSIFDFLQGNLGHFLVQIGLVQKGVKVKKDKVKKVSRTFFFTWNT